MREPNVTVMVRSFIGQPNRQIRVIGEAAQPMAMPYREGMTVLDVMIEVRGLTRYAAGNRAQIIRREAEDTAPQQIPVRLSDLLRTATFRRMCRCGRATRWSSRRAGSEPCRSPAQLQSLRRRRLAASLEGAAR